MDLYYLSWPIKLVSTLTLRCLGVRQVREKKDNAATKEERDSAASMLKVFKCSGRSGCCRAWSFLISQDDRFCEDEWQTTSFCVWIHVNTLGFWVKNSVFDELPMFHGQVTGKKVSASWSSSDSSGFDAFHQMPSQLDWGATPPKVRHQCALSDRTDHEAPTGVGLKLLLHACLSLWYTGVPPFIMFWIYILK